MRRGLFAFTLLLGWCAAAHAGEHNWRGVYVGANFGYGDAIAKADFSVLGLPLLSGSEDLSGGIYGAQLGYNFQIGRVVLGVETDINGTTQKARSTRLCVTSLCGLSVTQSSEDSIPWLGTLRGRVGYAFSRFMIYGTGGAGYGEFKSTQSLTSLLGSVTTQTSDQRLAWAAGAGIEVSISENWSAKFEYLYFDTGSFTTTYNLLGVGLITERSRLTDNVVRLGVNYRF